MASCTALGCSLAGTCEAFGLEVGQAESELAAECIRNAHWEGTQAWTEGKWTVLNKQQFHHDWSFTYKSRDGSNAVVDLEAWEESLRGLLTDVPPDDFYWNVKLHVPDDGFEIFDELDIIDEEMYDAAVFDVLGDVVCGGFAAPMRKAHGSKVAIILSEEMMANFAANNIAKACKRYADNGICLAGLVVNLRSNEADIAPIQRFADAIGTRILQVIPRDPLVGEAELFRKSIIEYAPESPVAVGIRDLAEKLWALDAEDCPVPEPLDGDRVRDVMRGPMRPEVAKRLRAAGRDVSEITARSAK